MVFYDDNATHVTVSSTLTAGHGEPKLSQGPRFGNAKMRRRHSVDFKPDPEQVLHHLVEPVVEEDRILCWYSKDEYDIIKARNSLIVKMMKTGHFKESDEHSFRGLEHKLKEGFRLRRSNKFAALNAVLEEQERQRGFGLFEPERIAKKYRRVSLNAAETAYVVGTRDAEESLCYHGSPQSPPSSPSESFFPHSPTTGVAERSYNYNRFDDSFDSETIDSNESNRTQHYVQGRQSYHQEYDRRDLRHMNTHKGEMTYHPQEAHGKEMYIHEAQDHEADTYIHQGTRHLESEMYNHENHDHVTEAYEHETQETEDYGYETHEPDASQEPDSFDHEQHKDEVRGLFAKVSFLKRTGGRMGRRCSM